MWKKLVEWWNKPKYSIIEMSESYIDYSEIFYAVFRSGLFFDDYVAIFSHRSQAENLIEVLTNS